MNTTGGINSLTQMGMHCWIRGIDRRVVHITFVDAGYG